MTIAEFIATRITIPTPAPADLAAFVIYLMDRGPAVTCDGTKATLYAYAFGYGDASTFSATSYELADHVAWPDEGRAA